MCHLEWNFKSKSQAIFQAKTLLNRAPGLLLGAVVGYRAGLVLTLWVVATLVVERYEVLGIDSTHLNDCSKM